MIEIPLGLHARKYVGYIAQIDDEDYELVSAYSWRAQPHRNTVYAAKKASPWYMHCLIMDFSGIDHIDGDGLNNQKYNLRKATPSQQRQNSIGLAGSSSQFKGVSWHIRKGKWHAAIKSNRKNWHIGYFDSEIDAALAYDRAARELFGEFAFTNFPQMRKDRM